MEKGRFMVLDSIKNDQDSILVSLKGDSKISLDKVIDLGILSIYHQITLDNFMNNQTQKNLGLDSAFQLMDELEINFQNSDQYSYELYLATALAQELKLTPKMNWILMTAFIESNDPQASGMISHYNSRNWKKFDTDFYQKLLEKPSEAPVWNKNEVKIIFDKKYSEYHKVSLALQDLNELSKVKTQTLEL
jgi:hypothetical protein